MIDIFGSVGMLVFRLFFGISLIPHSFPKITMNKQVKEMMKQIGIPKVFVDISLIIELAGGLLIILGTAYLLVSSVLTLFFLGTTIVSVVKMKKPLPSITNPGYDLDLLFLAGSLLLLLAGPGPLSLLPGPQI
ncbi:DoxX family protein [Metallosphaera hakonensis]|uniref:DoxX family membrane protein n=1 Tax=Metallosphaera hakonensis JCM 8857 = DSM 7519 TaxID=1293036 RepID=A0A2U9IT90_9CREN|nr:DoxX family protein [Metallosphaera hakonensis]AWR99244.1 DoxX family membrane protein [Metallosphaera hakonensis JCM 8857 = DSM 7519]